MSFLFRRPEPAESIDTVVSQHAQLKGTLSSQAGLRVDGQFQGRIESAGQVVIGPRAEVVADIVAHSVQIAGAVRGTIEARERVVILATGRVWGDVRAAMLQIEEGGFYRGTSELEDQEALVPPAADPAESELGEAERLPSRWGPRSGG